MKNFNYLIDKLRSFLSFKVIKLPRTWDSIKHLTPVEFSKRLVTVAPPLEIVSTYIDVIPDPNMFFFLSPAKRNCVDFSRMWFWYACVHNNLYIAKEIMITEEDNTRRHVFCVITDKRKSRFHLADYSWDEKSYDTLEKCVLLVKAKYGYKDNFFWEFI